MAIKPSDCNIFIQVWVDTTAVQNGSTRGVYLVDNRLTSGSSREGTPSLETVANTNDKVCWKLMNVNVQSTDSISVENFGNSSVFGVGGTPQRISSTVWTGQLEQNGNADYSITFNVQQGSGSGVTVEVQPSFSVS